MSPDSRVTYAEANYASHCADIYRQNQVSATVLTTPTRSIVSFVSEAPWRRLPRSGKPLQLHVGAVHVVISIGLVITIAHGTQHFTGTVPLIHMQFAAL